MNPPGGWAGVWAAIGIGAIYTWIQLKHPKLGRWRPAIERTLAVLGAVWLAGLLFSVVKTYGGAKAPAIAMGVAWLLFCFGLYLHVRRAGVERRDAERRADEAEVKAVLAEDRLKAAEQRATSETTDSVADSISEDSKSANPETLEQLRTIGRPFVAANQLLMQLSQEWIAPGNRSSISTEARRVENLERFAADLVHAHVRADRGGSADQVEALLVTVKAGGTESQARALLEAIDAAIPDYARLATSLARTIDTFNGKREILSNRYYRGLYDLNRDLFDNIRERRHRSDVGMLARWCNALDSLFAEPRADAGSPRIVMQWAHPPQPDELGIQWINNEDHPLKDIKTEVIDLSLWSDGAYRHDSKPKSAQIADSITVDPRPHEPPRRTLVMSRGGNRFEIRNYKHPNQKVLRSIDGRWRVTLETKDATGSWTVTSSLFFSWHRDRRPLLQIEPDPEGAGDH